METRAIQATAPGRPLRITFDWHVRERNASFRGRGIARVASPYRARLDLFGPRGGTLLSAAVVDGELRLPPGARGAGVVIPPVALLWSALGIFRPPARTERIGAVRENGAARLTYAGPRGRWTFTLVEGRVREAEFRPEGGGRHTVATNALGAFGVPGRVVYRDYAEFRELELSIERVDEREPFPPEIWTPAG